MKVLNYQVKIIKFELFFLIRKIRLPNRNFDSLGTLLAQNWWQIHTRTHKQTRKETHTHTDADTQTHRYTFKRAQT